MRTLFLVVRSAVSIGMRTRHHGMDVHLVKLVDGIAELVLHVTDAGDGVNWGGSWVFPVRLGVAYKIAGFSVDGDAQLASRMKWHGRVTANPCTASSEIGRKAREGKQMMNLLNRKPAGGPPLVAIVLV